MALLILLYLVFGILELTGWVDSAAEPLGEPDYEVRYFDAQNGEDHAPVLFLSGVIGEAMYESLKATIEKNSEKLDFNTDVFLDSEGGSLLWGMKIGQLIRENNFGTRIGGTRGNSGEVWEAVCFSACNFAFMGGVWRYFDIEDRFGVHRFFDGVDDFTPEDAQQDAQLTVAVMLEYLDEMGIDQDFFIKMSEQGPGDVELLDVAELQRMRVVNQGKNKPEWVHRLYDSGYATRGEQSTRQQDSVVNLKCPDGPSLNFIEWNPIYSKNPVADDTITLVVRNEEDGNPIYEKTVNENGRGFAIDEKNGLLRISVPLNRRDVLHIMGGSTLGLRYGTTDDESQAWGLDISFQAPIHRQVLSEFFSFCEAEL